MKKKELSDITQFKNNKKMIFALLNLKDITNYTIQKFYFNIAFVLHNLEVK